MTARIILLAALCAGCATTNGGGAAERLASGVVLLKPGASKSAAAAPADSMWQDIDLHGRQCYCGASTLTTGFGKDTLRVRRVGTEMYEPGVYERVMAEERAAAESLLSLREQAASAPASVTLSWTMPRLKANGDTLSTAPLDWQAAYSHQSGTYRAHEFWIRNYPDTMTLYWPTVRVEAAPIPVASGVARPGERVEWVALPVTAGAWPFSWWIRTRQRPNGNWSLWSNPVTRLNNE